MARIVFRHVKLSKPTIIFQFPDGTFLNKPFILYIIFLGHRVDTTHTIPTSRRYPLDTSKTHSRQTPDTCRIPSKQFPNTFQLPTKIFVWVLPFFLPSLFFLPWKNKVNSCSNQLKLVGVEFDNWS